MITGTWKNLLLILLTDLISISHKQLMKNKNLGERPEYVYWNKIVNFKQ
jgi:hypothetical protein